MLGMGWGMGMLHFSMPPSSTTPFKSDNSYLEDNDDCQGEARQHTQNQSIMIHYSSQLMVTNFMSNTQGINA